MLVLAVVAPSASASPGGCRQAGDREVDTPWFNTDVQQVEVCIDELYPTGEYRAVINSFYTDGGDGSRKFDDFRITVRIEQGGDVQVAANTCSVTREINATLSGSLQCVVEGTPVGGGPITADGSITYDIDSDGAGGETWSLHGTPPES